MSTRFYIYLILTALLLTGFIFWTSWYLLFILFALWGLMILFPQKTIKISRLIKKDYRVRWPLYFVGIFMLAILLRVFVFEIYNIPSGSMKQTLWPGDKVIVNKLTYGPKLPVSLKEVPWLNIFSKNRDEGHGSEKYIRLAGLSEIRHNDILVFNHPSSPDIYIKRCVGLAGDSLKLHHDNIFINGKKLKNPGTLKHEYRVYSKIHNKLERWATKNNVSIINWSDTFRVFNISLDTKEQLMKSGFVDSVRFMTREMKKSYYSSLSKRKSIISSNTRGAKFLNGNKKQRKWQNFHFGPLYIPKKGKKIKLDTNNISLYRHIIKNHEGHHLEINGDRIIIDGQRQHYYEFRQNYYFMLGDNRFNSSDSKTWGFVPEDHIIGKATTILFSTAKGKKKWKRIFKRIE